MKVVGLPLSRASMTDEFCALVEDRADRVFVMALSLNPEMLESSNDYVCAKAGFDFLFRAGYQLVSLDEFPRLSRYRHILMCPVWYLSDGRRRKPVEVADDIRSIMARLKLIPCLDVCYLTQGSPRLYDPVSASLLNGEAQLVDTCSSAEIAYRLAAVGTGLPCWIVDPMRDDLLPGHVNVIGCLGSLYGVAERRAEFVNRILDSERTWIVSVGDASRVEEVRPEEMARRIKSNSPALNAQTVVVQMGQSREDGRHLWEKVEPQQAPVADNKAAEKA